MKFAKSLAAAALLAGASVSAQASLLKDDSLFLTVIDTPLAANTSTTYDLNLDAFLGGKNYAAMLSSGSFSVDLSKDSNWTSFAKGLTSASQFFVGAAGAANGAGLFEYTTRDASSKTAIASTSIINNASSGVWLDNGRINANSSMATSNSQLVAYASSNLGGWWIASGNGANADGIWGKAAKAHAGIAYGSTGNFFADATGLANGTGVDSYNLLGTFALSGNTLTYTSAAAPVPAAVPLPAAVWMFGAGLMGVLRLTRRKSEAV